MPTRRQRRASSSGERSPERPSLCTRGGVVTGAVREQQRHELLHALGSRDLTFHRVSCQPRAHGKWYFINSTVCK